MNSIYNSFLFLLVATCVIGLAWDFYVSITKRITIARKKCVHYNLWAIIIIPFLAIISLIFIKRELIVIGSIIWGIGIISNIILNILSVKNKRKLDQEINIPELNFILKAALSLSRYVNHSLDSTKNEKLTQYEQDCRTARTIRTLEYLKKIRALAYNYINAKENFETENIKVYHNLIMIEKARLNQNGIEVDVNGEIKNIEKMLELI